MWTDEEAEAAIEAWELEEADRYAAEVSESTGLAPFGLVAVEADFSNGRARIYAVDDGTEAVIMASDFLGQ